MEENDSSNSIAAKDNTRQKGMIAEGSNGGSSTSGSSSSSSTSGSSDNTGNTSAPAGQNMQMGQPPEMNCAEGETCTPPEINCADGETCEMPEMPTEGMNGEFGGFGGGRGEMMTMQGTTDSVLHPAAYIAIGGGGVILGLLISYACFSKFFHLKPGKTFSSLGKFIWFIVVALLIAVGVGVLGYFIPVWTK